MDYMSERLVLRCDSCYFIDRIEYWREIDGKRRCPECEHDSHTTFTVPEGQLIYKEDALRRLERRLRKIIKLIEDSRINLPGGRPVPGILASGICGLIVPAIGYCGRGLFRNFLAEIMLRGAGDSGFCSYCNRPSKQLRTEGHISLCPECDEESERNVAQINAQLRFSDLDPKKEKPN